MAAAAVDLPPYARWPLAIIAGGGLAGLVQAASVGTRALSTVMTAGFGNPVVAAAETGGAVALAAAALLLPVLGLVLVVGLVAAIGRAGKRLTG